MKIGNLPEKRIQNNDNEDDPGSWRKNEEVSINVYQRPRRTKKRTNRHDEYNRNTMGISQPGHKNG